MTVDPVALQVADWCCRPDLMPGDIVVIDRGRKPKDGDYITWLEVRRYRVDDQGTPYLDSSHGRESVPDSILGTVTQIRRQY